MHSKKTQYLQVIKRMNEYRSQQNASYGEIIEDFCDVAKAFDVDNVRFRACIQAIPC